MIFDLARSGLYPSELSLHNVCKNFIAAGRRSTVLDEISLTINPGEFVAFVGPSGCGKTTLLGIMAGLLEPTAGYVKMDNVRITGPGDGRIVVFQQDSLFPWMTVRGNLEYGMARRGLSKRERRILCNQMLEGLELQRFADHYPKQISVGIAKMIEVGRALLGEPRVLLCDEPFGSLDTLTRERMQHFIESVWCGGGFTVGFVTHSLEEALMLADRVIVLSGQPATVRGQVLVKFKRPRAIALRTSPEFQALRAHLYKIIGELPGLPSFYV